MKKHHGIFLNVFSILILMLLACTATFSQDSGSPLDEINWQEGPSIAKLGYVAEIDLPEGYVFANAKDTKIILEESQNLVSGDELGLVTGLHSDWMIAFEFENAGYINDDEKNSLDADKMMKTMKDNNKKANEERKKRGWGTLDFVGWYREPHYDESSHNLEWGVILVDENDERTINYNTRLLGKGGVMVVTLVAPPESFETVLPELNSVVDNFNYTKGNQYAEYVKGDKVAKYGLSALVVGGTTAVAAKSGLLKGLWKIIVVIIVAIGAAIKGLLRLGKGRSEY